MPFNGERLKIARERMGITQKEAAQKLGVAHSTYNRYERKSEAFDPACNTLAAMAELFECSTDYLLGRHDYLSLKQEKSLHDERDDVARALETLPVDAQESILELLVACKMVNGMGMGGLLSSPQFGQVLSEISGLLKMAVVEAQHRKEAISEGSTEALEASWLRICLGCIDKQAGVTTALADFGANLTKSLLNIK